MFKLLPLLLAGLTLVTAQIQIISPSQDIYWVQKSSNNLVWTGDAPTTESQFTVYLANPNINLLTDRTALVATLDAFVKSYAMTPGDAPAGTGYTIQFANILNGSDVYAESQPFEIKPLGSTYPTVTPSALPSAGVTGGVSGGVTSTVSGSSGTVTGSGAPAATTSSTGGAGRVGVGAGAGVGGLIGLVGAGLGLLL